MVFVTIGAGSCPVRPGPAAAGKETLKQQPEPLAITVITVGNTVRLSLSSHSAGAGCCQQHGDPAGGGWWCDWRRLSSGSYVTQCVLEEYSRPNHSFVKRSHQEIVGCFFCCN